MVRKVRSMQPQIWLLEDRRRVLQVEDLVDTMHAENGAGIAAPQIGVSDAVFVAYGSGSNPRCDDTGAIPLSFLTRCVVICSVLAQVPV